MSRWMVTGCDGLDSEGEADRSFKLCDTNCIRSGPKVASTILPQ